MYHGINLVNIFESQTAEDKKIQLELDEQVIEKIWNNVIVNGASSKNTRFFLNLENLNPAKIIFVAKL